MEALVITPVKDSLGTTSKTIEAVVRAEGNFRYIVFNDFSKPETRNYLEQACHRYSFTLIHLEDITSTPSPNYKLILQRSYETAIKENKPILLIESDVIIEPSTINAMLQSAQELEAPGIIGAITVDVHGKYNFPYSYVKENRGQVYKTKHSISFCCTLLTVDFLKAFDFTRLPEKKDWFDIYISRQSRKHGFNNYLLTNVRVLHLPHSSRPWKQLKYTHPLKYYFHKLIQHRDRI